MPSIACEGSRIRSTIFSPNSVGQVLMRKSIARVLDRRILMRPSCGTRRSAMSSRDMTLRRAADLAGQLHRRLRDLLQHAVHAQAHAEDLLVRLEVDVRGAAADRIEHDLVDEAHDRRVFDVVARDVGADLLVAAADLERLEVDAVVVAEAGHRGVDLLDRLVEELLQLVVLDDDRPRRASPVWNLISSMRVQVGRVGDPQEQALAALEQRQHAVLGQQLVGDRLDGVEVDAQRSSGRAAARRIRWTPRWRCRGRWRRRRRSAG